MHIDRKMRKSNQQKGAQSPLIIEKRIGGEISKEQPFSSFLTRQDFYLSPQNAAQYLDVSVKFIYELIQSGKLKSQRIGNRIKRIKVKDLNEWLIAQDMKFGS